MFELSLAVPIFTTIAAFEIALGLYVLNKGRSSPVNRIFLLYCLLLGATNIPNLLLSNDINAGTASWAMGSLLLLVVLGMGVGYYLNSTVPFDIPLLLIDKRSYEYPSIALLFAFVMAVLSGDVVRTEGGWKMASDWTFLLAALLIVAYLVLTAVTWNRKRSLLQDEKALRQNTMIAIAMMTPFATILMAGGMERAGATVAGFFEVGALVSIVVLTYGITRYELFIPVQVSEDVSLRKRVAPLMKGTGYLFESASPDGMFAVMLQEMEAGTPAFIVTRTHPDQLRAKYQLTQTPMVWLSQSPGIDRIEPTNLQLLTHMVLGFVRKGQCIVVIEGLEYLLVNNDLNRVLKFLGQVRDTIIVEGSTLLVTVDPRTLTERERAILERELEPVL